MSGILGYLGPADHLPDPQIIGMSLNDLRHRGPDDSGFATFNPSTRLISQFKDNEPITARGPVGLGATLPHAFDPPAAAHQPFVDSANRYVLVFDGAIFNYRELREQLDVLGHRIRTSTYTEVLLEAYKVWGKDCLHRLHGMFAFAVWDMEEKRLFLARDPFGMKPLYFTEDGVFCFASQLGALLSLSSAARRANVNCLRRYLTKGWADGTDEETLLAGIRRFPPGCCGTISLAGNYQVSIERYWAVPETDHSEMQFDEAAAKLRALFLSSVDRHMPTEQPAAAALSGGIDTSSIVAAMRYLRGSKAEVHTFSFLSPGYEETNEEPWMRIVATRCLTIVHEVIFSPEKLVEDFDGFLFVQDWPASSPVIYAQKQVFEAARSANIRVMLSGQGAAYLAGFPRYLALRLATAIRNGKPVAAARLLLKAKSRASRSRLSLAREAIGAIVRETRQDRRENPRPSSHDSRRTNLFGTALRASLMDESLAGTLRVEDANSMANGVESRLPFLTPELVAFIFSLPESHLVTSDGETKAVFREAMRGITPDEILDRPGRMGFPVPVDAWLHALAPHCDRWLDSAASLPCLQTDVVRNTWKRFRAKPAVRQGSPDAFLLWRWIFLAGWARQFNVRFD
jgi:asparagine synthase (glutamine-hydrolysing)